jgi:hypothetical protein
MASSTHSLHSGDARSPCWPPRVQLTWNQRPPLFLPQPPLHCHWPSRSSDRQQANICCTVASASAASTVSLAVLVAASPVCRRAIHHHSSLLPLLLWLRREGASSRVRGLGRTLGAGAGFASFATSRVAHALSASVSALVAICAQRSWQRMAKRRLLASGPANAAGLESGARVCRQRAHPSAQVVCHGRCRRADGC